jgi:hypothetical protein
MPTSRNRLSQRDSNQIASGVAGAVHYLRCAIRKLAGAHPKLAHTKDGKLIIDVNFFKYSKQSHDLLQLRGGSAGLKSFIEAWKNQFSKVKFCPTNYPVIVLIDNDDGAKEIFNLLQGKKFNIIINLSTDSLFYHLNGPLYLVKTPIKGADYKSCPEDFFDPAVLATKIDGKAFNPDKGHDPASEYGKVVFADAVVRPHVNTINFDGFDPLLTRIEAVIQDYAKRKATAAKPTPSAVAIVP